MVGPRRSLRASASRIGSAAVVAITLALGAGPAAAATAPGAGEDPSATSTPVARVAAEPDTPLVVTIDRLTPGELPRRGPVVVSGQVTNVDDVTWSAVNLYPVFDDVPMTTADELAEAVDTDPDSVVGERNTDLLSTVDVLEPGESAAYSITVPHADLPDAGPGVYWFSVHALGASPDGRDNFADGRARTFLPSVPTEDRPSAVPTALVVPLMRPLVHSSDGALDDVTQWTTALSTGGRLRDLLDFATTARDVPITWLVDPALLDAIGRLAAGNPPRYLGPTDEDTSATGAPPTDEPTEGGEASSEPEEVDEDTAAAAAAATDWLDDFGNRVEGDQVLTVPFGNIDVPAALRLDPELLDLARAQKSDVLDRLGVESTPALTGPRGLIDLDTIAAGGDDTVLASDRLFADPTPAVASVDGTRVVVSTSAVEDGGPGPEPALGSLGLRQRLLSEAAIRLLGDDADPMVVVLPAQADLASPAEFFAGLDVDWLDLDRVDEITATAPAPLVPADEVTYPEAEAARWTPQSAFDTVDELIRSGDLLQALLTRNNRVSATVTEEALSGVSYPARKLPSRARAGMSSSLGWVQDRLEGVRITAPRGVTLSSASGSFAATISNALDEPVTVSVRARTDGGIEVDPPEPFTLGPDTRTNIQLEVRATSSRVHNVTLEVTDAEGNPLGSTDTLPIRSAQVSEVIWLIMGTGAGLLFLAIVVRLVRRVRRSRSGGDAVPAGR